MAILITCAALASCERGDGQTSAGTPGAPAAPPSGSAAKAAPPERVRAPALAGRGWYEADPEALGRKIDACLAGGESGGEDRVIALVAPHAGHHFAGREQGKVFARLRGRDIRRVFLIGPPHRAPVRGVAIPTYTHFMTPLGKVPVDLAAVEALLRCGAVFETNLGAHREEHSLEVLLPFLQRVLPAGFTIVPMLANLEPGDLPAVAAALRSVLRPGDLVVASSDSTHYGDRFDYYPFPGNEGLPDNLKRLDLDAAQRILAKDLEGYVAYKAETGITTCGFDPVCILLSILPPEATGVLTGYDTSATQTGDWGSVVTYVGIAFSGPDWKPVRPAAGAGLAAEERALALRIARESMERVVRTGKRFDPSEEGWSIPDSFRRDSGVFVTLKIDGDLRGCIGDIFAERPLWEAIAARAVSSAVEDPRFPPVREEELARIRIEISVLSPLEKVASPQDIVIGKHGILLLFDGHRRSVYLPQVAPEQGWDLETTLGSLCRKGGLPPDAWRDRRASFEVFTADVFGEDE